MVILGSVPILKEKSGNFISNGSLSLFLQAQFEDLYSSFSLSVGRRMVYREKLGCGESHSVGGTLGIMLKRTGYHNCFRNSK